MNCPLSCRTTMLREVLREKPCASASPGRRRVICSGGYLRGHSSQRELPGWGGGRHRKTQTFEFVGQPAQRFLDWHRILGRLGGGAFDRGQAPGGQVG